MRLLNTATLEFEELFGDKALKYAILSHRWETGEVAFEEFQSPRARKKKGSDSDINFVRDQFLPLFLDIFTIRIVQVQLIRTVAIVAKALFRSAFRIIVNEDSGGPIRFDKLKIVGSTLYDYYNLTSIE
jgi:hypothetical protein